MTIDFATQARAVPSNLPCDSLKVEAVQWRQTAEDIRNTGGRLLTLWGADDRDRDSCLRVYAVYIHPEARVTLLEHEIDDEVNPSYSSIADLFPAASRMERAIHDLLGIASTGEDKRPWLRHGGWPATKFPLRRDVDGNQQYPHHSEPYPFVQVEGDGVHEIPVGPVHAGTIEPGHFRFSVVGEKVLRLEERLGYTHKGIAKRFEEMKQRDAHRLAARISGDSTVAFSWAYCAALESITQTNCSPRGANLRALALEHERIANHLGDLGALGNDAGFAFGLTQFSRLKEDFLRTNSAAFGTRYLFDYIIPGGVATELSDDALSLLITRYVELEAAVNNLRSIYDEHEGLQDRFRDAGRLDRDLAETLGALGMAARASGVAYDLRIDHPWPPYTGLAPAIATQTSGDVAARVQVRFDEIIESLRLCRLLIEGIPTGPVASTIPVAEPNQLGLGLIEGWRGPVLIALETGPDESIRRCHAHDPSWQNWPLLEYAILGNIVPDFPLINKSFNLSYSGQDG
jgi:Ni,Fe-hydrogenase III large subunit/Ni,Fe-hydrogenase III component G